MKLFKNYTKPEKILTLSAVLVLLGISVFMLLYGILVINPNT